MSLENNASGAHQYDDEIDLKELFGVLWAGKFLIAAVTAVFAVGTIFYSLSIPNQYKATVVLAPAQAETGGLSGALGRLGGLASLAGVNIGDSFGSDYMIAQEIMRSWGFVEEFIEDNELAIEVYAAEGWNKTSGQLNISDDMYDISAQSWLLEDEASGELRAPTSWELFKRFEEMLSISHDQQSGLLTVSIEYYSPYVAKEWLDIYVEAINKHMQERQVLKVSNNIRYLEDQIAKTSIAEMREVFYTIIEEQTKNKMVAEASPEFVFTVVSSSMVPEKKSRPRRALICILGAFLGGVVGIVVTFVRHYSRSGSESVPFL